MTRHRMSHAQRVVIVIAAGLALYQFGTWCTTWGSRSFTGWVAYAPMSNSQFTPYVGGFHPWVRMMIWLFLIVLWLAFSLIVLEATPRDDANVALDD